MSKCILIKYKLSSYADQKKSKIIFVKVKNLHLTSKNNFWKKILKKTFDICFQISNVSTCVVWRKLKLQKIKCPLRMPLLKKACKRLKNTQTIFRFVGKTTMNVFVALNVDMLIIKNVYFHVNKIWLSIKPLPIGSVVNV